MFTKQIKNNNESFSPRDSWTVIKNLESKRTQKNILFNNIKISHFFNFLNFPKQNLPQKKKPFVNYQLFDLKLNLLCI